MAILRIKEIKQMSDKILEDKLKDLKMELMKLNAQRAMGTPPENPGKIKEIKRTVARILTIRKINQQTKRDIPTTKLDKNLKEVKNKQG